MEYVRRLVRTLVRPCVHTLKHKTSETSGSIAMKFYLKHHLDEEKYVLGKMRSEL